eukprot:316458_1
MQDIYQLPQMCYHSNISITFDVTAGSAYIDSVCVKGTKSSVSPTLNPTINTNNPSFNPTLEPTLPITVTSTLDNTIPTFDPTLNPTINTNTPTLEPTLPTATTPTELVSPHPTPHEILCDPLDNTTSTQWKFTAIETTYAYAGYFCSLYYCQPDESNYCCMRLYPKSKAIATRTDIDFSRYSDNIIMNYDIRLYYFRGTDRAYVFYSCDGKDPNNLIKIYDDSYGSNWMSDSFTFPDTCNNANNISIRFEANSNYVAAYIDNVCFYADTIIASNDPTISPSHPPTTTTTVPTFIPSISPTTAAPSSSPTVILPTTASPTLSPTSIVECDTFGPTSQSRWT